MKILLSLYLLFLSLVPISSKLDSNDFYDKVGKSYDYYETITDTNTTNYELIIIRGLIKNKAYYGIYFNSNEGYKNNLQLIYEDTRYEVVSKEEDGSFIIISIRSENIYELVLRNDGKDQTIAKLEIFLPSSVDKNEMVVGEGLGPVDVELKMAKLNSPIVEYAIYVSIGIIGVSVLIILLMFIFHKGFFNKEKRKMGIINTREIYDSKTETLKDTDFITPIEAVKEEEINVNDHYDHYDNNETKEYEVKDIKEYLKSYGYNTNYSSLNDDEKNQIMLRLMFLKDNHKISLDDYYEETKQLWRK